MIQRLFPALGTMNSITIFNENADRSEALLDMAEDRVTELHNKLSAFDEESEVSEVNRNAGVSPVSVTEDTFRLTEISLEYSRETKGAFDVTGGAAYKAWHDYIHSHEVSPEALRKYCTPGSFNFAELDPVKQTIFLKKKGMALDFGGIAKGYAAEAVTSLLLKHGITDALINLGGSVTAIGGTKKVGIRDPFLSESNYTAGKEDGFFGEIPLRNRSIVTSGSYEQHFTKGEKTYHHIIDPATSEPSESGLVSVSLIGDDPVLLDALATGIFIMGPVRGMGLVKKHGLGAVFVTNDGTVFTTPELSGYIS